MPSATKTTAYTKDKAGDLKDSGNAPIASGESSFSKLHWDKIAAKFSKEKDLLDKLGVKADKRRK